MTLIEESEFVACNDDMMVQEILKKIAPKEYDVMIRKSKEFAGTLSNVAKGERFQLEIWQAPNTYYMFILYTGFKLEADNGWNMFRINNAKDSSDLVNTVRQMMDESAVPGTSKVLYVDSVNLRN